MSFSVRVGAATARIPASIPEVLSSETLRRRYGEGAAAELRALAQESDPELLQEGLLAFGQRQERAGRLELAAEVYAAVAGGARVGDAATAVGAVRERPLQMRAQRHLDAILGRGAFGPRAEFLLRNLAQQASEPSAILAMGAAGAVFRMTRLATLSRLAASPNPGVLTQWLGARTFASLAGFALEAPTFTLVGRLGSEALGRSQDWSGSALARDFASSYLLLGGLKFAGWGSGAAYRGIAGAGTLRERPLQTLFQQTGMFGGILLGHSLEQWTGLRPHQDGATTLIDSLAMLLQFNVAGRLTRHAFGPRFAAWERQLDLQGERLARDPDALRFPQIFGNSEGGLALAGLANSGNPRPGEIFPQVLMMVGNRNGNGPRRRRPATGDNPEPAGLTPPAESRKSEADATAPFSTAAAQEGAAPTGRDPLEVESPIQLIRRIQDPELNFRESLREGDLEFHIKAPEGAELPASRLERHIPGILQYLNAISIAQGIPVGRKIVIVQEGEGLGWSRFSLIKGTESFECHPPLGKAGEAGEAEPRTPTPVPEAESPVEPPSSAAIRVPPEATETAARPAERANGGEGEAPKINLEEEEARTIPLRAPSTNSLARLLELSARQSQRRGIPGLILIEAGELRLEELQALTLESGTELPEGSTFKFFVAESRRSFRGTLESGRLRWEDLEDKSWDHAAIFSTATARSTVEVYQLLSAYSRAEAAPASSELVLKFRGLAPARDALAEFVASALDRFSLTGRDRLRVEFSSEEPALLFRLGAQGRWERE